MVAIVLTGLAGLLLLRGRGTLENSLLVGLGLGGALMAGGGYLDDRGHVAARRRLLIHAGAATFLVAALGGLPPLPMPGFELAAGWWGLALVVVFIVWVLNLYNFMDGIDGLSRVEAVMVSASAALLLWLSGQEELTAVTALYGASSVSFLA